MRRVNRSHAVSAVLLAVLAMLTTGDVAAAPTRTVSLRTEDGVTLWGTLYEAPRFPAPAVILVHMLTRSRDDWQSLAHRLADAGINALALDLRGHGASGPGPAGAGGGPDWSRLVLDVRAARVFLEGRPEQVRASAIGVAGASVGANAAILAAAADPAIKSLALLSAGLDYRGLRTAAAMQKFGSRPALLVAASNDPYALRSMRELAAAGGGLRETQTLDSAGHGTTMLSRDPNLARALVDWFQRTLL
jgi:pimeloyl-ACP methyl ester carboxylesterase